jgi:sigma-B regulation protein RsbU (phosphoserine phosphatase)
MKALAPEQSHTPTVEPLLLEVADVVNTTLDLDTLLRRVGELVRRVIDFEIFAILLLNEKTQELRVRFSIGHPPEVVEKMRIKVGEGVTGLAAQRREAVLVNDISKTRHYIQSLPTVRSELAIPLIVKNRVIGVIDIEAPQANYFTEEHRRLLTLIASRIAIGIENARLYTRVSRQARTLTVLSEVSRELTSILNLDELLKRIGKLVTRLIDYQMFSILLLDESGTKLVHRFSLRFNENVHVKHDIPVGRGLVGHAAAHRHAVLAPDVTKDPRYIPLNPETRSELCVPLFYKDKVIGVLDLEHTRRAFFTEDHVRTMSTLAAQVAIAIENAQLYERIAQQERRLEQDLRLARELQIRLLPPCCPVLPHAELAAKFKPARTIGGDLYDFISYADGGDSRVGVAIGDVSGKGAPAAIYAALASGFLRSHAVERPGASQMLSAINASLSARPIEAQYVAMTYAIWEEKGRVLHIANSGLPRPIYCHHGRVERVEATGLPLGLFAVAEYDEVTYHGHPGDVFVFFSDGIIDATNREGKLFGRERVEEVVARNCDRSADDLVTAIFRAVEEHAAGNDPFDDETVVAIKVRKPGEKKK